MYNGKYRSVISVIIQGDSHKQCLEVAKLAKNLCNAWMFAGVRYDEHKSARKGDVLCRELLIYQTAYAHDIIIFEESLKCVLRIFCYRGIVKITNREVTPTENNIK